MGVDGRKQHLELRGSASEVLRPARRVRHVWSSFRQPTSLGAACLAFNWKDSNGNLWLFGGQGFDANSNWNSLNDLWKFNPSTNQWAWMGGDTTLTSTPTGQGVYGTLGTPARRQPAGTQVGWCQLDRQERQFLAVGRYRDRCEPHCRLSQRPVGLPAIFNASCTRLPYQRHSGQRRSRSDSDNRSTITVTPDRRLHGQRGSYSRSHKQPERRGDASYLQLQLNQPCQHHRAAQRVLPPSPSQRPQPLPNPAPRPIKSPAEFHGMPGAERLWPAYSSSSFRNAVARGGQF